MAIQKLEPDYPLLILCKVLQVSRSGYYAWLARKDRINLHQSRKDQLLSHIRRIDKQVHHVYGYRRMYKQLKEEEHIACSKKEVYKIMKQHNIHPKRRKKYIRTTDSNHHLPVSPNLLGQTFQATHPNQVWLGDITYLSSVEGFLYLAAVMDLYTRRIIGWSMQEHMHTSLVVDAFNMAIQHNQHQPHFRDRLDPWLLVDESSIKAMPFGLDSFLVFHSDRGSQYASREFQHQLQENHILSSMSRKGNCYDNAPMESFFHTLKSEAIDRLVQPTIAELKACVFQYIEIFYNRTRLHSSLNYKSPKAFERQYASTIIDTHNQVLSYSSYSSMV